MREMRNEILAGNKCQKEPTRNRNVCTWIAWFIFSESTYFLVHFCFDSAKIFVFVKEYSSLLLLFESLGSIFR